MYARVKEDARFGTITSCAGREFSKKEFRPVPAGFEDEARNNEFLDVIDDEKVLPELELSSEDEKVLDLMESSQTFADDLEPYLKNDPEPVYDVTDSAFDLAQEYGIDLSDVDGSGSGGRILKSDVENFKIREG